MVTVEQTAKSLPASHRFGRNGNRRIGRNQGVVQALVILFAMAMEHVF
jgi:hypothetical protein